MKVESGVSWAGLITQVLPQTSAGNSFQDGIAIGKFHGVIMRADAQGLAHGHGKFVGQFGRRGRTKQPASFARHVISGVHRFLNVAAGFLQDFAHFAGHVAGVVFFALGQHLGGLKDDLGAARGGNQSPLHERSLRGVHGGIDIGLGGSLKDPDHVAGVGGIAIFEGLAGAGFDPFAVDEVLINVGPVAMFRREPGW